MLKAKFDFIRYANCWEDADLLLAALNPQAHSRILSVSSAGDNTLALLATAPELLVAVDVNQVQLYLMELKSVCFKKLEYEDMLSFLSGASANNIQIYHLIKGELSADARVFWDANQHIIISGIIFEGKFEKYLLSFGRKILPFIHNKKNVTRLFEKKDALAQKEFYEDTWNNFRWKLLFRVFFNRKILGVFGRDPEFLEQVEIRVSSFLYEHAALHLSSKDVQSNYFLAFMFLGKFDFGLPFYLRRENFEKIKSNLPALKMQQGYAQDAFRKFGKITHFNFSNIFEYMPKHTFEEFGKTLAMDTGAGSKFAFWNLMVTREFSTILPQSFHKLPAPDMVDKGFFYKEFITEIKI